MYRSTCKVICVSVPIVVDFTADEWKLPYVVWISKSCMSFEDCGYRLAAVLCLFRHRMRFVVCSLRPFITSLACIHVFSLTHFCWCKKFSCPHSCEKTLNWYIIGKRYVKFNSLQYTPDPLSFLGSTCMQQCLLPVEVYHLSILSFVERRFRYLSESKMWLAYNSASRVLGIWCNTKIHIKHLAIQTSKENNLRNFIVNHERFAKNITP